MVTIKDVAREANVAISTVSNVINGVDVVSDETKENVLKVIERLNYIPNLSGKFLKVSKTNVIGVFLTNVEGDFYSTLINAMHSEASKFGYSLTIFLNNQNKNDDSFKAILGNNIDGAIVLNETITSDHIKILKKNSTPIIFLDREISENNLKSVIIDNFTAIKNVTKYLIKIGHTEIGYIHGIDNNYDEKMRYNGYLSALNEHNLTLNKEFELQGRYSEIGAYTSVRDMIAKKKPLPEAFICANDVTAFGAIRALNDEGFSVPKDVSIVGFDNIEKTEYFTPTVSTIDSNSKEFGRKAIENLVKLINKEAVTSEMIETKLIIRNSTDVKI